MSRLILLRHGQSVWNVSHKIAGLIDVDLSGQGRLQARIAAKQLHDIKIDRIFTSNLKRAVQTGEEIQKAIGRSIPIRQNVALNERNFGTYSGGLKSQLKSDFGLAKYEASLKLWNTSPPDGETLESVSIRTVSFLHGVLEPALLQDESILVISHHHTLKTLVQYIERIDVAAIGEIQVANAVPIIYDFDTQTGSYTLVT